MAQRMTEERWSAIFTALTLGIDWMESELENADPEDTETYGALEHRWEQAKEARRILLHRRYKV